MEQLQWPGGRAIISSCFPSCRSRAEPEWSPWDGEIEEHGVLALLNVGSYIDTVLFWFAKSNQPTMNFVVLPSQTLCDADASPLRLAQDPQGPRLIRAKEWLWYELEQWFGQNDMAIFVFIICIFIRVVYPATIVADMRRITSTISQIIRTFRYTPLVCWSLGDVMCTKGFRGRRLVARVVTRGGGSSRKWFVSTCRRVSIPSHFSSCRHARPRHHRARVGAGITPGWL